MTATPQSDVTFLPRYQLLEPRKAQAWPIDGIGPFHEDDARHGDGAALRQCVRHLR